MTCQAIKYGLPYLHFHQLKNITERNPLHSHLVMSPPANLLLADLASTGVKQIPTSYIRPISDRPNLSDVQISDVPIPLIDLHGLNGPNHSLIIEQISQACENDGFFQVLKPCSFFFVIPCSLHSFLLSPLLVSYRSLL